MEEKNISLVYISVAVKVTGTQLTRVYKSFTGMTFLTFFPQVCIGLGSYAGSGSHCAPWQDKVVTEVE